MYVGLWSRMHAFERDALTRALEARAVIQATLMRVTIHLVARRDFWPFALATRAARRELWLRSMRRGATAAELEELAARLRGHLDEHGQISRKELDALVGKPHAIGVGLWIDLVRVPPSGTWERRRADLFAAAEDWLGPPPEMNADAAVAELVRSYLAGFGPASRADIASYSGLSRTALAPVYERLKLRTFRSEDGDELLDIARAPLPDPEQPVGVSFCRRGMRRCSSMRAAQVSCPSSTGRRSSTCATRTPTRSSSSTAPSPEPGSTATTRSSCTRSRSSTAPPGASCARTPTGSPTSTHSTRRRAPGPQRARRP
jgi:Winged helix DNA-binding domain